MSTFIFLLAFAFHGAHFMGLAQDAIETTRTPFGDLVCSRPAIPSRTFNIRDFGGVEGGEIKNTEAIRRSISAAADQGGGRIVIPPGRWLTGAIHLVDRIELHLEKGAELDFSQDPADYLPVVFSRHEGTECYKYSSFIYADSKTDIAITGDGILNGQGKPWWPWKTERSGLEAALVEMGNRGVPVGQRVFDGKDGKGLRPAFFQPIRCTNVLVEGVTFRYGAFWTIAPTYCENVIIRKVKIETEGEYGHTPNGDGIDPSSCKNVLIEECDFGTGDDCIALKSGRDADGRRVNVPTENVVIRHCTGRQGHGGIVIGSETSGGIRNVLAYDCSFSGTDRMIRIKTQRGRGGVLENMWFREIRGDRIKLEAIHINMLYTGNRLPMEARSEATPLVREMHFSNISQVSGDGYSLEILGIPEMPVHGIMFDSLSMSAAKGANIVDAESVSIAHSRIAPVASPTVCIAHSSDVTIIGAWVPVDANPFLEIEGTEVRRISLESMKIPTGATLLHTSPDLPAGVVHLKIK